MYVCILAVYLGLGLSLLNTIQNTFLESFYTYAGVSRVVFLNLPTVHRFRLGLDEAQRVNQFNCCNNYNDQDEKTCMRVPMPNNNNPSSRKILFNENRPCLFHLNFILGNQFYIML